MREPKWVDDPTRPGYEVTACVVTGTWQHKMSCYCQSARRPKAPVVVDVRKENADEPR